MHCNSGCLDQYPSFSHIPICFTFKVQLLHILHALLHFIYYMPFIMNPAKRNAIKITNMQAIHSENFLSINNYTMVNYIKVTKQLIC
jgi:hypothetical protein